MQPTSPVILGHHRPEIMVAENQPEYNTLPSLPLQNGMIMLSRWKMTDEELDQIKENKFVYLYMTTFGKPITPILITTELVNLEKIQIHNAKMLHPLWYDILVQFQKLIAILAAKKCSAHISEIDIEVDQTEILVTHKSKVLAKYDVANLMQEVNKIHEEILETIFEA